MHSDERADAPLPAYTSQARGVDGIWSLGAREEVVQQNQQPQQQMPAQQVQLQQPRLSLDTPPLADQPSQEAASVLGLQLHDRDSGCSGQQHGKPVVSQLYSPHSHQQRYGAQDGADHMGAGGAGQATQLPNALLMAAVDPGTASPTAAGMLVQSQQQGPRASEPKVPLVDEQPHVQPDLASPVDHCAHQDDVQEQQQLISWQQELSAAQRNPFLQVMQQQRQQQQLNGSSSAATTATNVSAFASAAADTGGSSGGGSAGGSTSGGGAGRALVTGRTITGELPVIPQGFDIAQAAAAAAAAAGGGLELQASRHFSVDRGLAGPAIAGVTAAAAVIGQSSQQQHPDEPVILRHTRQITCKTYLKRLNVTQYMSDHLLPSMEGSLRVSSQKMQAAFIAGHGNGRGGSGNSLRQRGHGQGRGAAATAMGSDDEYDPHSKNAGAGLALQRSAAAAVGGAGGGGGGQRSYEMLFKVAVKLVDSMGQVWPVTYEGVMCAGQRHLRLTCGWSEFIKAKKIMIGDSITFETRGGNRTALAVAVQKPGQEPEHMWGGQLPADEQIRVLVGSLRGDIAAAAAAAAGEGQGATVSGGHVLPLPGRHTSQPQHQLLCAVSGGAGRCRGGGGGVSRQVRRGTSRNSSKKRKQRDATDDDEDRDDRGHEASYDEVSSGSTAVTDSGAAAASSGSGLGSTGAAQGFGPAVQGLEALRVDSLSGRSRQAFAAAAAAAVAVVDAAAAAAAAAAEMPAVGAGYAGRGRGGPGSMEPGLQRWQQQQRHEYWDTRAPVASAAAAIAAGISAAVGTDGRMSHTDAANYYQQLTGLQQQQFPRHLHQRQQQAGLDVQCSDCPVSSSGSEGSWAQGSRLRDCQQQAAAGAGHKLLAEWAAGGRRSANDSVQWHKLQQQQYSQQQQHSQQQQQQQYIGGSRSAPAPGGDPTQLHGGATGSRYQGWQVSTGFLAGNAAANPSVSRFGSAIGQQQGITNQRAAPENGLHSGSHLHVGVSPASVALPASGGGGVPQVLERSGLQSVLSQSQHVLEQQQSTVCQGSLLPASSGIESAGIDRGMYQLSQGYQQVYGGSRSEMELAEAGSAPAAQGRDMGPPRSVLPQSRQQQQQWQQRDAWDCMWRMHPSASNRPAQSQQQQQQQQAVIAARGSWPVSGQTQQHSHQRGLLRLHRVEHAAQPDCTWDPDPLPPPPTTQQSSPQQQQQQPLSPYEQVRLQQQRQSQQVLARQPLHQWQLVGPAAAEQVDDAWDGEMMNTLAAAAAAPAGLSRPWQHHERQQSQGQLLESASTDVGSIGAMESVELVDTLLQLLGSEQAAEQQQQTGGTATLLTQEEQQQLAAAAVQVVQAECLQYAANQHQDHQPQLQAQLGGFLPQQWHQGQGRPSSDTSQLIPPSPALLPL